MEYFGILIIGFITIYGLWLIYKACRDEDERSMFGFIKTRTNVLKKYKEEIIICIWILSLAGMVFLAEISLFWCLICCAVFFCISVYMIRKDKYLDKLKD